MFAEEFLESCWGALFQGVNSLDQAENVGGHDEKVPKAAGACVPVGVRCSARDENGRTGAGFDFVFTGLHAEDAFEHVPGFVIVVVEVARGDQARGICGAAGVLPFGDDERIVW